MLTVDFSYFPLKSGERVLDLGCGEGRHVINTFLEGEVLSVGVDLSLQDLGTAQEKFSDFAGAQWQILLHQHQAAWSCVDGVCFAREKCVDCAVGQYSPVSGL